MATNSIKKHILARSGNPSSLFIQDTEIYSFPTDPVLDITNNFSLNVWVKMPNSTVSSNTYFVRRYESTTNNRIWGLVQRSSTRAIAVINSSNGSSSYYNNGTKIVADGKWHNVGFTYKDKTVRLYVDGVLDTETTNSALANDLKSNPDVLMGNGANLPGFYLNRMKYYNRVLSDEEMLLLAKGVNISRVGLVGEWDMNEKEGNVIYNKSQYGDRLDGTITCSRATDTPN